MKQNSKTDNRQIAMLAHHTCQWWNMVFIQTDRFLEAMEVSDGSLPWEKDTQVFLSERLYLILAIHYAIDGIHQLNKSIDGHPFAKILNDIYKIAPRKDILDLRNLNVHETAYLLGEGRKGNNHVSVNEDGMKFESTASYTVQIGEVCVLGNVNISKLLPCMKDHLQTVREKTEEIFNALSYT